MTTLKITVDNKSNAQLLAKLLKSMTFVKKVEEELPFPKVENQFVLLKDIFNSIEPDRLFHTIINPIEWQKNIRDEWETR